METQGGRGGAYRTEDEADDGDLFDDGLDRPAHPDVDADAFLAAQNDLLAWEDEETSPDIYGDAGEDARGAAGDEGGGSHRP